MTTSLSLEINTPRDPRSRRPWWRFFVQFSLRTLLIVVTLAAIVCWWFLQPETTDEQLAGNHLKLRRQVRYLKLDPPDLGPPGKIVLNGIGKGLIKMLNSGDWRLRDTHDDLLVAGRYENDRPHGQWTIYHTNGHKAAEGEVFRGARRGPWKTWDEHGRLLEEATFVAREQPFIFSKPPPSETLARLPWQSYRQGPARAWHPNGQLKFEGSYQNDARHGTWTNYDNQGHVISKAEYQSDNPTTP